MSVVQKIKWFVAVLGVFLIILMTNLLDKQNFLKIEEVVENIYNKQLLAKELLYDVSVKFHKKELAYVKNDVQYIENQNDKINEQISEDLQMFDRTDAKRRERKILKKLKKNHEELIQLEKKSSSSGMANDSIYNASYSKLFSAIEGNLKELSEEQIKEGRNQTFYAQDAVNIANLFSKIEIYILIFLGLVIQFIILYSPKKKAETGGVDDE